MINVVFGTLVMIGMVLSLFLFAMRGEKEKIAALKKIVLGVHPSRLKRLAKEIQRKTFHFFGLLIPIVYYYGMTSGYITKAFSLWVLGVATALGFAMDVCWGEFFSLTVATSCFEKNNESVQNFFLSFMPIQRPDERFTFTGSSWFMLGCFLTIFLFKVAIATTALIFLIVGDIAAAVVGIAYGKVKLVNGKSLEGTMAMFFVCCLIGLFMFQSIRLFEYIALLGAMSAALSELLVKGINDNLVIPIVSGIFMELARIRLSPLVREAGADGDFF